MRRAVPAILDQGVWSAASFLVSALAGRLLGVDDFGIFALALVILYGVGGIVNSLIVDPAGVIGPRFFDDDLRRYGGLLVVVAASMGLVLAGTGVIVATVGSGRTADSIAAGMIIAFPTFTSWTARRLPYLTSQPGQALVGSLAYLAGVIGVLVAWDRLGTLNVVSVVLVLGIAAGLHGILMLAMWRPSWKGVGDPVLRRRATVEHWDYGRWFLASEASSWILNYGFAALSAAVLSLRAAGGYRASQVLMRPYGIVFQGLGLFLLPRYARRAAHDGLPSLVGDVRRVGAGLTGMAVLVFAILAVWGDAIMALVFGPDFESFGNLAAAMAGAMIFHAWIVAMTMALQASGFPRDAFFGQLTSAVVSLIGGVALGLTAGLAGLIAALWMATIARAGVIYLLFRRRLRATDETASPVEGRRSTH